LLPAAELIWTTRSITLQVNQLESFRHQFLHLRLGDPSGLQTQPEGNVVLDGQVGEKGVILKYDIGVALIGRQVVDDLAINENVARVRVFQASDQPQRGGLATTAGPQQREKLTFRNRQTQVVHGDDVAKPFCHPHQFNAGNPFHDTLRRSK
jgi:hypothetical protein